MSLLAILSQLLPPKDLGWIGLLYFLAVTSSLMCGGQLKSPNQRGKKIIGVLLVLIGATIPWMLSHRILRAFFALTSLVYLIRNTQMALDESCGQWDVKKRLSHTIWHFDHRMALETYRHFSGSFFGSWILNNVFATIVFSLQSFIP